MLTSFTFPAEEAALAAQQAETEVEPNHTTDTTNLVESVPKEDHLLSGEQAPGPEGKEEVQKETEVVEQPDKMDIAPENQEDASEQPRDDDACGVCGLPGDLLCCDGPCGRAFHLVCVCLSQEPEAEKWYCEDCQFGGDQVVNFECNC